MGAVATGGKVMGVLGVWRGGGRGRRAYGLVVERVEEVKGFGGGSL